MNAHVLMVLYTGIVFLSAGACLLEVNRLLGETFHTKLTAHWFWRGLCFFGALALFWYGALILFPGRAVQVQHMSIGLPVIGTVLLGVVLALLDRVMADREPPPWSVTFLRLLALLGRDNLLKGAAFRLKPAAFCDPAVAEVTQGRVVRLLVIISAIILIACIAGFILISSAADPAI